MNTEVIDRLVEKDPSLESSRTVLESMNPGTYHSPQLGVWGDFWI